MNDHDFESSFRAWSLGEASEPASGSLRGRVLTIPSATPQQRRWVVPLLTGRFQSMFGATKFVVAGVIVALFGGFLLLAQPFGQQVGSVPGAATEAAPMVPVEFTARFIPVSSVRAATYETVDGRVEGRGNAWSPSISGMSDPRLDGTMTYSEDLDQYLAPGSYALGTVTYRIENDDGAWQGSTPIFKEGSEDGPSVVVLVGEDTYQGLYAVMDTSDWDAIRGVIFPAPPPSAPTAP